MTAQISNVAIVNDEEFDIVGHTGKLIHPQDFGIQTMMASTACWRGFRSTYQLQEENLVLKDISINQELALTIPFLGKRYRLPFKRKIRAFNGYRPTDGVDEDDTFLFNSIYQDINMPVSYSGYIMIATTFINDLYVHMGFQAPWKYEKVLELELKHGKLIKIEDLSDKMMQYREVIMAEREGNAVDIENPEAIKEWITHSFEQKYQR